jgi:hypothetical protein
MISFLKLFFINKLESSNSQEFLLLLMLIAVKCEFNLQDHLGFIISIVTFSHHAVRN